MAQYATSGADLGQLIKQFPGREVQIRQLTILFSPTFASPSTTVIHGPEATGKSSIITRLLQVNGARHGIVKCQECVTGRQLLERTVSSCARAVGEAEDTGYTKCENMSMLAVQLQKILEKVGSKFILVFDGVDRQREAPPTLLPALARFGELIPNLSIVLILTSPRPRILHSTGVPHVYFPAYTKSESLAILATIPRPVFFADHLTDVEMEDDDDDDNDNDGRDEDDTAPEDSVWLWSRFCGAVYDSLGKGAARDMFSLRAVCHRLWPPFVAPIRDGTYGTRDFSRLMVAKRSLFQGEEVLVKAVVPPARPDDEDNPWRVAQQARDGRHSHQLPYYSKFLLCAAYLASYNPSRQDLLYFVKASELRKKKRKQRAGAATAAGGGGQGASAAKHRKIQRRLLGPQAFVLERMLAIFHAILPDPVVSTADLQTQIATLSSLRLLIRTSNAADVLEAQTKWRVNVGWDYIHHLARSVNFEITNHLAE